MSTCSFIFSLLFIFCLFSHFDTSIRPLITEAEPSSVNSFSLGFLDKDRLKVRVGRLKRSQVIYFCFGLTRRCFFKERRYHWFWLRFDLLVDVSIQLCDIHVVWGSVSAEMKSAYWHSWRDAYICEGIPPQLFFHTRSILLPNLSEERVLQSGSSQTLSLLAAGCHHIHFSPWWGGAIHLVFNNWLLYFFTSNVLLGLSNLRSLLIVFSCYQYFQAHHLFLSIK